MKTTTFLIAILITALLFSCSKDSEDDLIAPQNGQGQNNGQGGNDGNFQFNYNEDIAPIMQSSCVNCHASPPVNGAPFALINFDQVSQRAGGILSAMEKQSGTPGAMPPAGRLPEATIDIVRQWISDGLPEN